MRHTFAELTIALLGHAARGAHQTGRAGADPGIRLRLVDLGVEIPTPEQQKPEAFAAMQKAGAEKWWPIIKAAGMKGD
jgi:hypothetical protein